MSLLHVRYLGLQPYQTIFDAMRQFTLTRAPNTTDEIWLLEHPPVFTQGQAGKPEHLLNAADIPVIQSDRGGQITYHGPGQLVIYLLLDLHRLQKGVRALVSLLENTLIDYLQAWQIPAKARCDAPGVYVDDAKIASIGLRIRKGFTYHGMALNVAMDLSPFSQINPCGFSQLRMTQLRDFVPHITINEVMPQMSTQLSVNLGYTGCSFFSALGS